MQRIALVDPSDVTREPLRNLLLGIDSVWIESECARYEFFLGIIEQNIPDIAVVSLDADQNKALQLIAQLAAEYPRLPILAISNGRDGQLILQALRSGAREFLTQPVSLEEMLKALRRLGEGGINSEGKIREKTESLVIAVLGSRGGVGCTSIAVNLGCTLAQDKNNSVALLDLDLALGDADVALDLRPPYRTFADLVPEINKLDMRVLKGSLFQHETGLSLLPRPARIEELGMLHEDHLQRVIGLLRATYSHLILDLSKSFTVMDYTAMHMADVILLVTQLELTSVTNTVRILTSLDAEEGLKDKIRVVLNRVGSDFTEGGIDQSKAEETIGRQIYWKVPNDYKAMIGARNEGKPLIEHSPKSKAQLSISGLASALCGKAAKPEDGGEKKGGSWWWKK